MKILGTAVPNVITIALNYAQFRIAIALISFNVGPGHIYINYRYE